ncbi:MAG: hypothetical protein AVDCRST_MAG68-3473, partial [uncultured Gemmatimonadetes bacterium]
EPPVHRRRAPPGRRLRPRGIPRLARSRRGARGCSRAAQRPGRGRAPAAPGRPPRVRCRRHRVRRRLRASGRPPPRRPRRGTHPRPARRPAARPFAGRRGQRGRRDRRVRAGAGGRQHVGAAAGAFRQRRAHGRDADGGGRGGAGAGPAARHAGAHGCRGLPARGAAHRPGCARGDEPGAPRRLPLPAPRGSGAHPPLAHIAGHGDPLARGVRPHAPPGPARHRGALPIRERSRRPGAFVRRAGAERAAGGQRGGGAGARAPRRARRRARHEPRRERQRRPRTGQLLRAGISGRAGAAAGARGPVSGHHRRRVAGPARHARAGLRGGAARGRAQHRRPRR